MVRSGPNQQLATVWGRSISNESRTEPSVHWAAAHSRQPEQGAQGKAAGGDEMGLPYLADSAEACSLGGDGGAAAVPAHPRNSVGFAEDRPRPGAGPKLEVSGMGCAAGARAHWALSYQVAVSV